MSGGGVLRRYGARTLVALFLVAAVVTGGSSFEGEHIQAAGFAISAALLAVIFGLGLHWVTGAVRTFLLFALCLAMLGAAQVIPLPLSWTSALPDRDVAYGGLAALGHSPGAFPLSLSPESTAASFLAFLTPLAGFCLVASLKWSRGAEMLKWTIPLLGAASALLGLAQVFFGDSPRLYLHERTSEGLPAGFFANVNHQASFLLMCLPFAASLAADLRRDWDAGDAHVARALVLAASGLLIIAGVFGAGSVAGYMLLAPVTLFSLLLLSSGGRGAGSPLLGAGLVLGTLLFAAVFVFSSPVLEGLGARSVSEGELSRTGIALRSMDVLEQHWKAGTGLGSFAEVYHLYEDPASVVYVYIAHVHNDYFEWLIETGAAGGVLLGAFLVWFLVQFIRVWTSTKAGAASLRRAASIACLVIALHSFADYPLRTPAVATLGAMCLALMVVPRKMRDGPPVAEVAGSTEAIRTVTL